MDKKILKQMLDTLKVLKELSKQILFLNKETDQYYIFNKNIIVNNKKIGEVKNIEFLENNNVVINIKELDQAVKEIKQKNTEECEYSENKFYIKYNIENVEKYFSFKTLSFCNYIEDKITLEPIMLGVEFPCDYLKEDIYEMYVKENNITLEPNDKVFATINETLLFTFKENERGYFDKYKINEEFELIRFTLETENYVLSRDFNTVALT